MLITVLLFTAGFLFSAYAVFLFWAARKNRYLCQNLPEPIAVPFDLTMDQPTHLSFVAEGNLHYTVEVVFERAMDFDTLDRLVINIGQDKEFGVYVEENGKLLTLDGYTGTSYGKEVNLCLTSFNVRKGNQYDITITPCKDYPELAVTNPQAEAAVAFWTYKNSEWHDKNTMRFAVALFLVGLGLILLGGWRSQAPPLS